jgi:hypothetical protein
MVPDISPRCGLPGRATIGRRDGLGTRQRYYALTGQCPHLAEAGVSPLKEGVGFM